MEDKTITPAKLRSQLQERKEAMRRRQEEKPKENSPVENLTRVEKSLTKDNLNQSLSRIPKSQITYGKLLGAGGFGQVYQATWNYTEVAVKELLLKNLTSASVKDFEKEINVHLKLRHPHIVQLYGVTAEQPFGMVMEYMSKGSLDSFLREHARELLSWSLRYKIALEVGIGLLYLHQNYIIHRDLKSLNILLDENTRAKLADFGLAKLRSETASHTQAASGLKGTAQWTAPELFTSLEPDYNEKTDVYSYGVVLWELAAHAYPYQKANQYAIPTLVMKGTREIFPTDTPTKYAQLGQRCWGGEPSNRPTVAESLGILKEMMPPSEEAGRLPPSTTSSVSSHSSGYLPPSGSINPAQSKSSPSSADNAPSGYLAQTQVQSGSQDTNSAYLANSSQPSAESGYLGITRTQVQSRGKSKLPPTPPVQKPSFKQETATALYDYAPLTSGQLAFKKGDLIKIIDKTDEWWLGELNGKTGEVPSNYIKLTEEKAKRDRRDKNESRISTSSSKNKRAPSKKTQHTKSAKSESPSLKRVDSHPIGLLSATPSKSSTHSDENGANLEVKGLEDIQKTSNNPSSFFAAKPLLPKYECKSTLEGHSGWVSCVAVLPNGQVISGSRDETLKVWDSATGKCVATWQGHSGTVNCVAVLPNGRVISGSHDNTLKVWDGATGNCVATWQGHSDYVYCVAVLPNGQVISGSSDGILKVWDSATGNCVATWQGHSDWVRCVAVLPNGRVISGSHDNALKVWDSATGGCVATLQEHNRRGVNCVAVLPNGQVISWSDDKTFKVWDSATGKCVATWQGHSDWVRCVAVLPNGQVISGDTDKTLKVWDSATRKRVATWQGHSDWVYCVAVLPNGQVISGSRDQTLKVWVDKNALVLEEKKDVSFNAFSR